MRGAARHRLLRLVIAAMAAMGFALSAGPASAAVSVSSYVAVVTIDPDGTLHVTATLQFTGAAPATVEQRFATAVDTLNKRQYVYTMDAIAARAGDRVLPIQITESGNTLAVNMTTSGVTEPVELSYAVKGAAVRETTGATTVTWPLLQGLSLPVESFDASVRAPALAQFVDCKAGPAQAPGACVYYAAATHENPDPIFHDGPRAAGEIVQMIIRFPGSAVEANATIRDLWTVERAFSTQPLPLGVAVGLGLAGAVLFTVLHFRYGRDAQSAAEPIVVAEFHPVAAGRSEFRVLHDVRPGQVGTVLDERVDPIDVTATLVDLAVRGHLRIEELPRASVYEPADWQLVRLESDEPMERYEWVLLEALTPASGEPAKVSAMVRAVGAAVPEVQSRLYDDVVRHGWFTHRPDLTRNAWSGAGWVALIVSLTTTIGLAAFTNYGLTGLALIAVALGLLVVAPRMPARTASGAGLLNGLGLLRGQLLTQSTREIAQGQELQNISRVLPYAIVLGGTDRWLEALAALDLENAHAEQGLTWYRGPADWRLRDLPGSLRNFVTIVQGTLFTR